MGAPGRWTVLAVCCLSLFISTLDITIVNVALPSIRDSLHASLSGLQWTVDAYTLVLAILLMLSGSLGDRLGRRRVFRAGLALFSLGSLLCSVAPALGWLVAFRGLQAVGGSMLNPVALAIIVTAFPDRQERARAIGVWGAVVGVSMALGPVLGGVLVDSIGWRSIFWVNVPVGLAALALTGRHVPESRAAHTRELDLPGQALVILVLGALTYAIIEAPAHGWGSGETLGVLALAGLAVAALLVVERRRRQPLIELRFFRSVPFSAATVTAVAAFAALGTFLFVNTLYPQNVRGLSPIEAGLWTLPMAAAGGLCAPLSGRLVAARGARLPMVLAGAATAAGALLLVDVQPHTAEGRLLAAYVLIGIGFGLVNAPITNTATSGMPREQAGVAAAIASTSRQIGSVLGVAVSGSLLAGRSGTAFTTGEHAVWIMVTGCGVAVVLLGLAGTSGRAQATARRAHETMTTQETAAV